MDTGSARRYELLSLLLGYPSDEILAGSDEIAAAAAALPSGPASDLVQRFVSRLLVTPALQLQQQYVETFDLQKRASLYLTFFSHGDTRKRGQELLRLKRLYRAAGATLEGGELPDYLPLVLEFASINPEGGRWVLREYRAGLELLHRHLRQQHSPYADLTEAVRTGLPRLGVADAAEIRRLLEAGPPREAVGLEPFGPPEVMPVDGAHP
jgi:nitrate reductase delta subunit